MICSARSGTTSQTMRSITSVDSLSSAISSELPGSRPAVSASRAAIFASVRSTSSERLVGVPLTSGARFIALDGAMPVAACAGGGGAGERIDGTVPGALLPTGAIGGTAITLVLVCVAGGGGCVPPPAGILIVGIPMIVAERGGIAADAAAAAGTGAPLAAAAAAGAATAATGGAAAATATAAWPGLATPAAALPTISVFFSSIVWVSHGLGRLASAPTWMPRTLSYGAALPTRITTGMPDV